MRTRSLLAPTAVAALLLAVAGIAPGQAASPSASRPAAGPGARCQPSWHLVATPPPPDATSPDTANFAQLLSVDAVSSTEAVFAGSTASLYAPHPWTLRWDGRSVSQAPTPSQLEADRTPEATIVESPSSFDSATDGWTIPDRNPTGGTLDPDTTTIEHFHAGDWTLTPMPVSPDLAHKGLWLKAIDARTPSDAWTVGAFYAVGSGHLFGAEPVGALIEHWDGTRWSIVPNPADTQEGVTLLGLHARSADDVWVVGWQGRGAATTPFVEHWDGATWRVLPAPPGSNGPSLFTAVHADAADDAWAVGAQNAPGASNDDRHYQTLIEHWDGDHWTTVTLPDGGAGLVGGLTGVYAASPTDVWATFGGDSNWTASWASSPKTQAFLHWDGKTWTTVPVPGPHEFNLEYTFNAIDGTGPDNVWAVGEAAFDDRDHGNPTALEPVIAHLSCG